jgi:hypothetical protein
MLPQAKTGARMIKEQQLLDDALARNVITPEQYQQMSSMVEGSINRNPDERFRVVSGFSEVFISVGLLLLFGGLSSILALSISSAAVTSCLMGGVAWLAATYFVERKRFLLPSIVSCLYCATAIGSAMWAMQSTGDSYLRSLDKLVIWQAMLPLGASFLVLGTAAWRFRIPFLMLPIGILFAAMVTVAGHWAGNSISYRLLLGLSGTLILGTALYFDLKDPQRVRRASDFAFWCYMIGSPLTIHPIFFTLIWNAKSADISIAIFLIVFSAAVTIVALMINRRALVLSTLIYLAGSISYLTAHISGSSSALVALLPVFLIGLYVVCLGTHWKRARSKLMRRLTWRPWFNKLPPF